MQAKTPHMERLILIFLLITAGSFGQTNTSKKYLTKLFKESIEQNKRKSILIDSNAWEINNINNEYYKADTLKVYNFNRNNSNKFCEYIGWTFYRKDSFILHKAHHCDEPPTNSVSTNKDRLKIKFTKSENKTILELYNFEKLLNQFEVLSAKKTELETEIVLLRIK